MSKYVDGFVLPLAKEKVEEYAAFANIAAQVWMDHGALEFRESAGDDLEVENMLSFKTIAGAAENETVIFSWIVYESKEDRDRINAAAMADPRLNEMMKDQEKPFDFKRMAYGGFKTLISSAK